MNTWDKMWKFVVIITLLLFPVTVLATDVVMMNKPPSPWWQILLIDLVLALGGALLALVGRLVAKAFDYLSERTGWAFLARVDDLMMEIANDIYQAEIQPLKAAKADGRITPDELAQFKQVALDRAKSYLGMKGISKLAGIVNGAGVDQVLGSKLEKAVKASKILGAGGAPRLNPPSV